MRDVIPRMPAPLVQHDGTDNNAGERHAAKRFIAQLRRAPPPLQCISTEDSLSANAPHSETLHDHGLHDLRGGTAGEHALLCQQVQAAEPAGRVTYDERHDRAVGVVHRFRFGGDMPLNASHADVRGNCMEYWEIGQDKVQPFSWVTDLRVNKRNVLHLMQGGRARWKIEHEPFHTLQNQDDNFEHNYEHGAQNLSGVFAMLMMLAFLVDQAQQLWCALFQAGWAKLGSKRLGDRPTGYQSLVTSAKMRASFLRGGEGRTIYDDPRSLRQSRRRGIPHLRFGCIGQQFFGHPRASNEAASAKAHRCSCRTWAGAL
jgi:hypothetical protein